MSVLVVFGQEAMAASLVVEKNAVCWWEPQYHWVRPLWHADGSAEMSFVLRIPRGIQVNDKPLVYQSVLQSPGRAAQVARLEPYLDGGTWKVVARAGELADVMLFSQVTTQTHTQYAQAFFFLWASPDSKYIPQQVENLPKNWPVLLLTSQNRERPFQVGAPFSVHLWSQPEDDQWTVALLDELHGATNLPDPQKLEKYTAGKYVGISPMQQSAPVFLSYQPPPDSKLDRQWSGIQKQMVLIMQGQASGHTISCSFSLGRNQGLHKEFAYGVAVVASALSIGIGVTCLVRFRNKRFYKWPYY